VTVSLKILLGKEAGIAVMAALDDVQRQTGEVNTWAAGHVANIATNKSSLTPLALHACKDRTRMFERPG
jgi:hypothetical protein